MNRANSQDYGTDHSQDYGTDQNLKIMEQIKISRLWNWYKSQDYGTDQTQNG